MSLPWLKSVDESFEDNSSSVHGSITPAEVRAGEPIQAVIATKRAGAVVTKKVRVWRLSPIGVEVILPKDLEQIKTGDQFDIEISVGLSTSKLIGVTATSRHSEKGFEILGLRLCSREVETWGGEDRRSIARWSTSKEFLPTGIAPNPGKFNDFIFFKVNNLSAEGMQVSTSLRNKFIFPGMKLESTISLPLIGQVRIVFEIANSSMRSEGGKEVLVLGCKYIRPTSSVLSLISQYIFQFGPPTSLKEMKQNGLTAPNATPGIEFRYVRTKLEFEQVLNLRKLAYGEAGKISLHDDVSDIFDARSRIVIGVYKGTVIASTRLIYSEMTDQMEHEQFLTFPESIPRKDEICEITRVCTHPDYRGSDILLGLFRFVGVTVAQSGRRYILGCATKELLPFYMKLGFKDTNLSYKHRDLNNIEHHIFLCDVVSGLSGKGVSPLIWNVVWSDVAEYLTERNVLEYDTNANIRMGVFRLLKPLSFFLLRMSKKPKRRKAP